MAKFKKVTRNVLVHRRDEAGSLLQSQVFTAGEVVGEASDWWSLVPAHSVDLILREDDEEAPDREVDEEVDLIDVAGSTVDQVLTWVKTADGVERVVRAQVAMNAETQGGKPRVSLVAALRELGAE